VVVVAVREGYTPPLETRSLYEDKEFPDLDSLPLCASPQHITIMFQFKFDLDDADDEIVSSVPAEPKISSETIETAPFVELNMTHLVCSIPIIFLRPFMT